MSRAELDGLLDDERANAIVAWVLVGVLLAVGVEELAVGDYYWAIFGLAVAALAVIPPIAYRSRAVMLPWEVLLMAALPILGLAIGAERLTGAFATYLAVAAIALVVAVELQAFTSVKMSAAFAVVFVAIGTMATAGLWALVQWGFDVFLGTDLIGDNETLMWEFVYSALAGVGAGVVFEVYFRRSVSLEDRVPAEAVPEVVPEEAIDE